MTEPGPRSRRGAGSTEATPPRSASDFAAIVSNYWPTAMEMADPAANVPHRPLYFHALAASPSWEKQEYVVSTLPEYPGATYSKELPKRLAHVDLHSLIAVFRHARGIPDA